MDQRRDYADDRLIRGCVYCGGIAQTRDHVPSRILLDEPYPENLPVVGACFRCNNGFCRDEEYLAALVESVVAGTTDPERIRRKRVRDTLTHSPALKSRLDAARRVDDGGTSFSPDPVRFRNVLWKLAVGHAAFELSQPCRDRDCSVIWWPIETMDAETRDAFEAPHITDIWAEVGSRSMQRDVVTVATLMGADGDVREVRGAINDWIDVQHARYSYHAIDSSVGVIVKMIIGGYLACQVHWPS